MYSTVIESRPTAVMHPLPQPSGFKASQSTIEAFKTSKEEIAAQAEKLAPGAYSIPVRIQPETNNDPTLSDYVTPSFIQSKKEKQIVTSEETVSPQVSMQRAIEGDIKQLTNKIEITANKEDKIKVRMDIFFNT